MRTLTSLLCQYSRAMPLVIVAIQSHACAVVQFFASAIGLKVPRTRFLPVKCTSDLLSAQSNLYTVRHGSLTRNPARPVLTDPIIKLGPEFAHLSDFVRRVPVIPDVLDLEHLTVSGDVYFGRGVIVRVRSVFVCEPGPFVTLMTR
jgi:UTP--glucose-1-phosphate uridylyltransferase